MYGPKYEGLRGLSIFSSRVDSSRFSCSWPLAKVFDVYVAIYCKIKNCHYSWGHSIPHGRRPTRKSPCPKHSIEIPGNVPVAASPITMDQTSTQSR